MEMLIFIFLGVIFIVVAMIKSDVSGIKYQQIQLYQMLDSLRKELEEGSDEVPIGEDDEEPAELDVVREEERAPRCEDEGNVASGAMPPPIPDYHRFGFRTSEIPDETLKIEETEKTDDTSEPEMQPESEGKAVIQPILTPEANTKIEEKAQTEKAISSWKDNWEKFIGENLLSKIGILVLIAGIGFFVKYAIDRNWINEVTRTVLGLGVGLTLWAIAYRIRDSYRNFSSVLAGGGFAICFVCVAIAFHIYGIFSPLATLISLISLATVMTGVSMKYDRPELAIIAITGAFAAPFIASDGGGSYLFVLGYTAILDTAVTIITRRKEWWSLPSLTCLLTYTVCIIEWFTDSFDDESGWWLAVVSFYFIIFSVTIIAGLDRKKNKDSINTLLTTSFIVNNIAFLSLSSSLTGHIAWLSHFESAAAVMGLAVNSGIYLKYFCRKPKNFVSNLPIIFMAGYLLAAILMQFTRPGILIAGAGIEAAMMSWFYSRTGKGVFKGLALIIGVPLAMFLFTQSMTETESVYGSDSSAWGYIVTGAAFIGAAYAMLGRLKDETAPDTLMRLGEMWGGAAIAAIGINIIAWKYTSAPFAQGLTLLSEATMMLGVLFTTSRYRLRSNYLVMPALATSLLMVCAVTDTDSFASDIPLLIAMILFAAVYFRIAIEVYRLGNFTSRHMQAYTVYFNISIIAFVLTVTFQLLDIASLNHLRSAGFSIALASCATAEMILGMRQRSRLLRVMALCVFGVVIVKLAIYDLWRMAAVGRIIVFILLGVALLSVSFLYQRLRGLLIDRE